MSSIDISVHLHHGETPIGRIDGRGKHVWLTIETGTGSLTIFTRDRMQAEALLAAFCHRGCAFKVNPPIGYKIPDAKNVTIHPEDGRPLDDDDSSIADEPEGEPTI